MKSARFRTSASFVAAVVYFLVAWHLRPLGHENPLMLWAGALVPLLVGIPSIQLAGASLLVPAVWLLFGLCVPVGGGLWTLPLVALVLLALAHRTGSRMAALVATAMLVLWADLPSLLSGYRPDPFRIVLGVASAVGLVLFLKELVVHRVAALAPVRVRVHRAGSHLTR